MFPDLLTNPSARFSRGRGAVRFKHVIQVESRHRRLALDELGQLRGFPKGWTGAGMTDGQRVFCVGNALVVDNPHAIGKVIAERHGCGAL